MAWTYERGEHRTKHCWSHDYAGFVDGKRGSVGKCPNTLTQELAETLLNSGVEFKRDEADVFPSYIYNFHEGVIYEATVSTPGRSFHGYPWRGSIPRRVLTELRRRAEEQGFVRQFDKWVREYGDG